MLAVRADIVGIAQNRAPLSYPETMTETRELLPVCPHCGGGNIKLGIRCGGGRGYAGLFFATKWGHETEDACSDLCLDCGTITRTYVMTTDKDWETYSSD